MLRRLSEVNHVTMELTPELQEKKIFLIEGLKRTYKVQYDAIQPLPYIKDRLYCVDKVFVEGGVEVCLAPELTRGTGGSWERLESYKSVYTDFRLKSKRRIIQGEPGYGKSTLTLQLAYDWCNDLSKSPMNNVEILILLRLRQLGRVKSLFGAIKLFLLSHEPRVSQRDIEKIINSCSSVHITLDGYDEYPGRDSNDNDDVHRIIKMELFADFDVSLTTRYLPENLRKETKRAKLTGFDDKARDEYIRKAVVGNNDEAVEKIKQRLYENSILADLCQVPLIFVMFAHMAHDQRDFMKFKSVTQFFKHTIRCFYDHLKRKRKLYDNESNRFYLHEMEHHELDKIAFQGLNKRNQQLSWIKTGFCQRVGPESYDQYILIGILVEEDVVSDDSTEDNVLFTTMVRFYHKLFCEWYAAHHLVTLAKIAYYLEDKLMFLDPFDLQYLFRFACGLDPDAGKKLINHLKSLPGGDTFAILCILEQTGDVNDIMDSVKDLCSRDVKIQEGDSALLQRSTTQLLEIASNNDIPISCLHLDYSSIKFEGDTIILHSGIPLPKLPTVDKIHLDGSNVQHDNTETLPGIFSYRNLFRRHDDAQSANQKTLTEKDILNWFRYGMKCRCIKELMFHQLQLPNSVSPEAFRNKVKTRNIQVRWRPFDIDFHLDLQNGHWEVDDIQVILNKTSGTVSLSERNNILQDTSTLQLLEVARNHDIPVSCLHLEYSSIKFEGDTIKLHSGITLPILPTVEKLHIAGSNIEYDKWISEAFFFLLHPHRLDNEHYGKNMTLAGKDILNWFHYGMKCGRVKELMFIKFVLPTSFSPEAFTDTMKTQKIQVRWRPFDIDFHLDLQNGHWEVDDIQVMKNKNSGTVSLSDQNSILQDTSTLQLLEVARNHDIPISCLRLKYSSIKFEGDTMILHSGIPLPIIPTVEKIHIAASITRYGNTGTLTDNDLLNLFQYGMKCGRVKELMLDQLQLPTSFSPEAFTDTMKTQNIQVRWRPFDIEFHLDQQNGHWEVDNIGTLRQLCSDTVHIKNSDGILKQASTIMFIHIASSHEVPISCLDLKDSFSKTDDGDVILHSGLHLSCPVSVKKVVINTRRRREMTEKEVVDILMFVQQSHILEELEFEGCVLPLTFSSESILSELQSRKIKVFWSNYGYRLDLQSGIWKVDNEDVVRKLCTKGIYIQRHDSELLQRCTIQLLENASNYDVDVDTVKRLCTEEVDIDGDDSELLQRCTIKLLEHASYHEIPISCLYLYESFSKIDGGDVILHSGLRLSCPVSVKKVEIRTERGREMTETEVFDILMFVQQSHILEQLEFDGCLLPSISFSEDILAEFKTRDIKVLWRSYGYSLNLQSGAWEVDVDTVKRICTNDVSISRNDSDSIQRCTIQLLENASDHDIPISCLYLTDSFSMIDGGDIILHSGLCLFCPVSVKKVVINTYNEGRELTETEVVHILMFVQQSHMLEKLTFNCCLLPQSIPAESIPSILKSRNVRVSWTPDYFQLNTLNLQSGRWMDSDNIQITDTKYIDKVRGFRRLFGHTEWQKGRLAAETQ